ncbi:hypothetical protein QA596_03825 [Balneolales bacterium ANBcel1]|nr:hypothetical protein [Balneolales bacterium ANBcel1]
MMQRLLLILLASLILFGMYSCDTGLQGNMNENIPPSTYLTINEINLENDDSAQGRRLVSQVHISWWGDDPDGYVTGFEFAITDREWRYTPETEDEVEWVFTEKTDSVFVLPIPFGERVADVRFTVRAIDNEGARDPEGASVVFPIENSPPEIRLHRTTTPQHDMEVPPDTTFHIASFGWTATDPDGEANLSHYEFVVNDTLGNWIEVTPDVSFMSMVIDEPNGDQSTASVYLGRSFTPSDHVLENVRMNSRNTFYIRAVDNAGAESQLDTLSWHIKEQTSRILFINDFPGAMGEEALAFHRQLLADIGFTQVDYLHVLDGVATGGQKVPISNSFHRPVQPTLNRVLAAWDHIYWISGNMDRNITYALRSTIDFFNNGGTMFVNIPTKRMSDEDAIFDFLPYTGMEPVPPGGFTSFRFTNDAPFFPHATVPVDTLRLTRGSESVYPMLPAGDTRRYFDGDFRTRPFFDPNLDFSRLIVAGNPEQTLIHFGYDLNRFEYNDALKSALEFLLIDELNFEQ